LIGAKSGSGGDEHDGFLRFLAQEKRAERPLEAQDVAFLHGAEDVIVNAPPGTWRTWSWTKFVVVGCVRHREAPPRSVLEENVDVLPRQEHEALVRREL